MSARRLRRAMVDEQLVPRGIDDERVLAAMRSVPRHEFVPDLPLVRAYADAPQPIGLGQTISQPYVVALTAQLLELDEDDVVLDVGTGCGYAAAVLARLCRAVTSIERHRELARLAARRLAALGVDTVTVVEGDGTLGWPDGAPYDGIAVAAAARTVPPALVEQLRDGGRLVIPVGGRRGQRLERLRRRGDDVEREQLGGVRFVPLVGG